MVPVASLRGPFDRHPLARELIVAVAAVESFGLWLALLAWAVRRYVPLGAVDAPGGPTVGLAVTNFLTGAILLAGAALFAYAFARVRDDELAPGLPDRRTLGYAAGAVAAGLALVCGVRLVAAVSGGSLSAATGVSYAPDAAASVAALVTAVGLFFAVPVYAVVTHVVVQRSVRRAVRPAVAVGLTPVVVAAADPTDVLYADPVGTTVGVVLVVLAIAVPVVAAEAYDRRWLTALTALPTLLLLAGLAVEWVAADPETTTVAYRATEAAVVAVGAYAYERSDSMLPSALAYAAFVVATEALVFAAQVGVGVPI